MTSDPPVAEPKRDSSPKLPEVFNSPADFVSGEQRSWLRRRGPVSGFVTWQMYWINKMLIRSLLRVRIEGREHLPQTGPAIFCPNHSSSFDPPLVAASLPYRIMKRCRWYGRRDRVTANSLQSLLCYAARVVPIEPDETALAAAALAIDAGEFLIWFPEGRRSLDGQLQQFKPGIGALLRHRDVPVHLLHFEGAAEAWPARRKLPVKLSNIRLRIGPACTHHELLKQASPTDRPEDELEDDLNQQLADLLHDRMSQMQQPDPQQP